MSFDKNPSSPDQIVDPKKKTTKVNIGLAIGVLLFFVIGAFAFAWVINRPPQEPPTPVSSE